MARFTAALAGMLVLVASATLAADEKPASKQRPLGTWKRTAGDNSITFTFKADTFRGIIKAGGNTLEVEADYGMSKDGVLFGRLNKVKKEGDGPSEGDLFSFKVKVEKNTLMLSDLKSEHGGAEAKELLQGEYEKVAKAKKEKE